MSNDEEKKTHSKRGVPLFLYQHPWFSMSEKILLVYSTMADKDGRCSLSSRTTLTLIGEEITDASLTALRKARAKLESQGHLRHEPVIQKDKTTRHTWIVTAYATSLDAVEVWQSFQPDREIRDLGFGSGSGKPEAAKPQKPVTVKPPSAEVNSWFDNMAATEITPTDLKEDSDAAHAA